jgi:hypothetical protein
VAYSGSGALALADGARLDDLRLANRRIAESPTCPMIRTIAWRPPPCARAYRKPERAYGSFVRSDFLRVHVPMTGIGAGPFSRALLRAIRVARS